jgi:hypothetical protein
MVRKPYNFNGLGAPKCNNLALYVEEAIYPKSVYTAWMPEK